MVLGVTQRSLLVFLMMTAFGCSGAYTNSSSRERTTDARQLSAMSPLERLRAKRPPNLPAGTQVYHPPVVEIEAPGETVVVSPDAVVATTATHITVRTISGLRTFSLATSKVTYNAEVQELYVPPGHAAPKNAGPLVETIR